MGIIFEVKDKTDRKLRMTDYNWYHIVKRHPEIASNKEKIVETLENPDKITDSLEDEETKYYYKYYKNRPSPYRYMRVIAKYLNGKGFIISSHFVKAMQ
ncbi:hypothetical protein COV15_01810 [Candidatus Woesearchaeota archaeon CG10_big_fil_rev_8_21_14_0_10_34_12]|nr:MAG: hypothetical protein COV15_01810 [Candidatus Woesearchaeota archaeon CG10_big_fil_rev_8_21_14_0_10_34_12]